MVGKNPDLVLQSRFPAYKKGEQRNTGFEKLIQEGTLTALAIEGIKETCYIDTKNLPLLIKAIESSNPLTYTHTRFLAPLDNLL